MTLVSSNINWTRDHWRYILEADAKGYYAYLPAIFIYHDLNFRFFEEIEAEKYNDENLYYDYRAGDREKAINKYFCGTALAQLPFFLLAHGLSHIFSNPTDGYSYWYPVMVNVAALFYLLFGLLNLNQILDRFKIREIDRVLTFLAIAFGTNLFYYTVGEPGMSHIFSFGLMTYFIKLSFDFFDDSRGKPIILIALILGLITLIRPINLLIIFSLPFFAGSHQRIQSGFSTLSKNWGRALIGLTAFMLVVGLQLIIYKVSTGSFWLYSYGNERFNWLDPHFFDILFSYRKGLFLYTPIYLVSLIGIFYLFRMNRFRAISITCFLTLLTYVLSSWWMWYYGGSFSGRVYVEYLPFFAILLAITLQHLEKPRKRVFFAAFLFTLVSLCQVQTYQYRYYEIHWSEMNKEKYWDVFLRIDRLIK